jgi:hypothetical protein
MTDVACSLPQAAALLYQSRAELALRRSEVERLALEYDPVVLLIVGAARAQLVADEAMIDRALGSVYIASRLNDLNWASRLAARPGSLDQPHLWVRTTGAS